MLADTMYVMETRLVDRIDDLTDRFDALSCEVSCEYDQRQCDRLERAIEQTQAKLDRLYDDMARNGL